MEVFKNDRELKIKAGNEYNDDNYKINIELYYYKLFYDTMT